MHSSEKSGRGAAAPVVPVPRRIRPLCARSLTCCPANALLRRPSLPVLCPSRVPAPIFVQSSSAAKLECFRLETLRAFKGLYF